MIWIDSSFAVEWLLGTARAQSVHLLEVSGAEVSQIETSLAILPMQYAETFTFFLRRGEPAQRVANSLEALLLIHPEKLHLELASSLYLESRKNKKSKSSLADAVLAAVARERNEAIASFDSDFSRLGFKEKNGIWTVTAQDQ